jgi:integron integrase
MLPPDPTANRGRFSLLGRVRSALEVRRRSPRTIEAYSFWVRRYVHFHGRRHPSTMGPAEVGEFLTDLAVTKRVSASTQNQALAALQFLYRDVLHRPLEGLSDVVSARRPQRLPNVLSREEVAVVLAQMRGATRLVALLLYGGGLRLMEALQLRVKDLDLERAVLTVRAGKGNKDRVTVIPRSVVAALRVHLHAVRRVHARDLRAGAGYVELPGALHRKLPAASRLFEWQWVFPAARSYRCPETGERRRHHKHESVVQRAVTDAGRAAGLTRRVTCHTFRHSFATHLLEDGYDIRSIQELLGHHDVRTTMVYTHVLNRGGRLVNSPADSLVLPSDATGDSATRRD